MYDRHQMKNGSVEIVVSLGSRYAASGGGTDDARGNRIEIKNYTKKNVFMKKNNETKKKTDRRNTN